MTPYYEDDSVRLYHGDCREIAPALNLAADCVITDPPYGETSLAWDRWPDGWPSVAATITDDLWCFGSMRMFFDRLPEFSEWWLGQEIVWEKQNGSGFATDRFRRVHEFAVQWYRGAWTDLRRETPRLGTKGPDKSVRRSATDPAHHGSRGESAYVDDGTRLQQSVIGVPNCHARALHPTEKPSGILAPLIQYSCPKYGTVVDLFAGSGSTLRTAKDLGRMAVGIEADEAYCEVAASRLAQDSFDLEAA